MSSASKRAEYYRDLAKRYLRLAVSTDNSSHYLRIAVQYSALAETEELKTARWRRRMAATRFGSPGMRKVERKDKVSLRSRCTAMLAGLRTLIQARRGPDR
jgi:hypothetical protein